MASIYSTGTASVTNGTAAVTGSGTAWAIALVTGGMFSSAGVSIPILSVDSDTTLTLAYVWPGSTASGATYAIARENSDAAGIVDLYDRLSRVLVTLSLAGITPNASGTITQRNAIVLSSGDAGYLFLHAELGVAFVFYRWNGTAWEGPFPIAGEAGSSNVVGTSASSLLIATGAKTFTIVESARGWSAGARLRATSRANAANFMEGTITSYSVNTLVMSIDLIGGSGTLADWNINLGGQPGAAGAAGAGDVVGPASAVADRIAVFNGTTGKLIKDGGKLVADLAPLVSPSFTTPTLGVATATSVNKVAITAPATSATLTIPNGVTMTGPAASGTVMTLGNAETVSGVKTFSAIPVISAGGITFPATDVPSSNANTLDDYEEGTFTPTMVGSTLAGTGTYTAQTGKYTKIGNLVSYTVNIAWSAHTGTGTMTIAGLSFSTVGSGVVAAVYFNGVTFTNSPQAYIPSGSSSISIEAAVTNANSAPIAVDTAANIRVSGQLFTA